MASASAWMVARWSSEIRFARRDTPNAKYNASGAKGSSQNEDVERNQEARSAAQTRTMEPGAPQRRRERDWGNAAKTVPPLPGARRVDPGVPLREPDNGDAGFHRPPPVRK